jgi:hypothetical protein
MSESIIKTVDVVNRAGNHPISMIRRIVSMGPEAKTTNGKWPDPPKIRPHIFVRGMLKFCV